MLRIAVGRRCGLGIESATDFHGFSRIERKADSSLFPSVACRNDKFHGSSLVRITGWVRTLRQAAAPEGYLYSAKVIGLYACGMFPSTAVKQFSPS